MRASLPLLLFLAAGAGGCLTPSTNIVPSSADFALLEIQLRG